MSAYLPVSTGQHHYHGENMNNKGADVAVYVQKYKGFDMAVEPYRGLGRKWTIRASVRRDKEMFTSRKKPISIVPGIASRRPAKPGSGIAARSSTGWPGIDGRYFLPPSPAIAALARGIAA
ncbi:hypothetical protein ACFS3C_16245 [Azotobacter vinelandii]